MEIPHASSGDQPSTPTITDTGPSLSLELDSEAPTLRDTLSNDLDLEDQMNAPDGDEEPDSSAINDMESSTNNKLGSTNTRCDDSVEPTPGSDQWIENDKWAKQRNSCSSDGVVGAMQVDEQAPQINRRFYRGLDRPSVVARNTAKRKEQQARRRRQEATDVDADVDATDGTGIENNRRRHTAIERAGSRRQSMVELMSTLYARASAPEDLISATLVVEDAGEVVVAERVSLSERKWKSVVFIMCCVMVLAIAVPIALLTEVWKDEVNDVVVMAPTTSFPSVQPSSPPSFDPSPTLEIIQRRGHVLCGLANRSITDEDLDLKLCRCIAAVLLGDPEKYSHPGALTASNRFQSVNDRTVDVLVMSATHTIEREVKEPSTGVGFSFSSPYYYDGMAYFGHGTYVKCAEERKRYNECSNLRICVIQPSTSFNFVRSSFPSDFVQAFSYDDLEELLRTMWNGTCVYAMDRSWLMPHLSSDENVDKGYILGDKLMTKEPHAIVTRNDDSQFSDIVNWVIQALYYGEEQGMTKDPSLCQNYTKMTSSVSDLNFLNAVHCVGNYRELMHDQDQFSLAINKINDGTTGMLYSTPFGELGNDNDVIGSVGLLDNIRNKQGSLKCGIVSSNGITGGIAQNDHITGMSISYCQTMAAALFNGNYEAVKLFNFSGYDSTSLDALNNGSIDVLAGMRVEWKYDFESSQSLGGFQFSTPYYYGSSNNETAIDDASFFSLATREDDVMFSSFVNCIVLATFFAQENGITRERIKEMPLTSIFGSEFNWALRDAISYGGSYDEIYTKHFVDVAEEERGRNTLNEGGPQIHSFPGLKGPSLYT